MTGSSFAIARMNMVLHDMEGEIVKNDYNLSPSRYIETAVAIEHRDVQTLLDELAKLDTAATRLDSELKEIFTGLGYKWEGQ